MNTLFAAKSVARMATMPSFSRGFATGTAKWFNMTKGFGFITPDDGNQPDGEFCCFFDKMLDTIVKKCIFSQ